MNYLKVASVELLLVLVLAVCEPAGAIEVAGELLVDLDGGDPSAGTPVWTNNGTLGDFVEVGNAILTVHDGAPAVSFNSFGCLGDAYQSQVNATAGLVGLDPTRTIEAWVLNPVITGEETIVAWGKRGGPDGSNVSFNYGSNSQFGAVGHWGAIESYVFCCFIKNTKFNFTVFVRYKVY